MEGERSTRRRDRNAMTETPHLQSYFQWCKPGHRGLQYETKENFSLSSCSVSNQRWLPHLSHPLPHSLNLREARWHKTEDVTSVSSHLLYIWLLGECLVSELQKAVVSLCVVRSMSWQTSKRWDEKKRKLCEVYSVSLQLQRHSTLHTVLLFIFGPSVVPSRSHPAITVSPPGVLQEVRIWKPKSTKMHCEVKNKLFSAAGWGGMWQNPCVAAGLRLIGTIWAELFVYCNNQTPLSPLTASSSLLTCWDWLYSSVSWFRIPHWSIRERLDCVALGLWLLLLKNMQLWIHQSNPGIWYPDFFLNSWDKYYVLVKPNGIT